MTHYRTTVTCPVCGAIFDVQYHASKETHDQSVAMLAGDGRREHRRLSPQCSKDDRWYLGWNVNTEDLAKHN